MCVDVEPGMRTVNAVAREAAVKTSLLVLALSLRDRGCCSSPYVCAAVAADAAGDAAARGGGGSQEAIRPSRC